jgi:hypothetical protein
MLLKRISANLCMCACVRARVRIRSWFSWFKIRSPSYKRGKETSEPIEIGECLNYTIGVPTTKSLLAHSWFVSQSVSHGVEVYTKQRTLNRNPASVRAHRQVPSLTIPPDAVYIPRTVGTTEHEGGSERILGWQQSRNRLWLYRHNYRTVNNIIPLQNNASYLH